MLTYPPVHLVAFTLSALVITLHNDNQCVFMQICDMFVSSLQNSCLAHCLFNVVFLSG